LWWRIYAWRKLSDYVRGLSLLRNRGGSQRRRVPIYEFGELSKVANLLFFSLPVSYGRRGSLQGVAVAKG
jgi:hypothetical protein